MSLGLLALRVVVGLLFLRHASHKAFGSSHRVFGWLGGPGPDATAEWMESLGLRPGRVNMLAAAICEAAGGALLALGLLTPLPTLLLTAVLMTAILTAHVPRFWNTENGVEFPLVMLTAAFTVGCTGPGRYSLGDAFGFHFGWDWGVGALGLGVAGSLAVIAAGRSVARASHTREA